MKKDNGFCKKFGFHACPGTPTGIFNLSFSAKGSRVFTLGFFYARWPKLALGHKGMKKDNGF
ncbi:hypothetical protein B7P33_12540 [Sediminicola luteus]|uniref:Uncharacterized protein n=1 Tax=Sediminicola luteus TaxID=319238 RepID=A0A2A4G8H2_9FLAO|nr:hypothetical protein B7P33_12540 [Sediminicola luteus]